jgi:hypothetical protein
MSRRPSPVPCFIGLVLLLFAGCGGSKPSEDVKLGGIALTEVLDGLMNRATRTLSGINGLTAAEAAVPQLRAINDDFEDLRFHAPKLPEAGQTELAKRARHHYPQLEAMVGAVQRSPALASLLGAEMDRMLAHLSMLMAPPYREEDLS